MPRAGVMEWVSIGLSLSAVAVLIRYATRPRCPLCARRHDRRVVVVEHSPSPAPPGPAEAGPRPIRWRSEPLVSLPTDVASLN
ncbi:MAG TPA: hypothetical protein VGU73_07095 [Acidimicrobiia bacterium]|nr:hypothetical protein [Acidimicrobiia bacterium]